jgi:hypothetical protein
MTAKIKISLEDPEIRAVWETVLEARREVASWPAWKRGEDVPAASEDASVPAPKTEATEPDK